jgi:multicomponent Na+:H+ antiporter subunit G
MILVTAALILVGTILMVPAAIGIIRLPDTYMRISAATKAATLGAGCLLAAVAVHFQDTSTTTRAIAVLIFIFLTAPVGGHMLGRAAFLDNAQLWDKTRINELKNRYAPGTHALSSGGAGKKRVKATKKRDH